MVYSMATRVFSYLPKICSAAEFALFVCIFCIFVVPLQQEHCCGYHFAYLVQNDLMPGAEWCSYVNTL